MSEKFNYELIKVDEVQGRYVTLEAILPFLKTLGSRFQVETIGTSVLGRNIKSVSVGEGSKRIFMWSQMHGNESTTTKALLDLLKYLSGSSAQVDLILRECKLSIIPILNPDGANAYTRFNANQTDLNRDAQNLTQPESQILSSQFKTFAPDFCFNLHDQRTMYNVGSTDKPATLSFLSPAVDHERTINGPRSAAMKLIGSIDNMLQDHIPGQVGRYDDTYNENCVGDAFQSTGCPTVLFEAGHFQGDYQREETRKFIFHCLRHSLEVIADKSFETFTIDDYAKIPENGKQFVDILIKNLHEYDARFNRGISASIVFEEVLQNDDILFLPKAAQLEAPSTVFGHATYDCAIFEDYEKLKAQKELCSIIDTF